MNAADKEKITGIAALTFTCSVTVVFYLFVKNALSAIKVRKYVIKHYTSLNWLKLIGASQPFLDLQKTEIFFLDFCERDDGNGKRVASREKEHGKGIPGISTEINNLPCERKKGIT